MKKTIMKKIYLLVLLALSTVSFGQTRVLTVDGSLWSASPGAWKLPDLVTDTTIPATIANTSDSNQVSNSVLNSTVDATYYQRLVTTSATTAVGDMKFAGTGTLVIDVFSDQFYTFGGAALVHQSIDVATKLTIDCKVQLINSFATTSTNRNSVLKVGGIAGNILEFSSLSEIVAGGGGPTVTWPGSGTVQLNGKITGTRGLTTGIGTTIFGSTFDPSGFNIAANTITVAGNGNAIVNTAANGNFYKNTLGRITMSGSAGQSSTLTLNNANVWNSPLFISTTSVDRNTGGNLTLNADQTVNTGTVNFSSATSVLNLTVAAGVSVTFGNSAAATWTAGCAFNIYGFDGATSIKFGSSAAALTTAQLAQICLRDGVNAGKAVILDATGKLIVDTATNTWLGTTSNVYNLPANWSTGAVPTINSNVIIPAVIFPAVNPIAASNATMYSLTVDSGATLTVNFGQVLSVNGLISNSGTINLFSNAPLFQRYPISNTGSGIFNVSRSSSILKRLDYTMWSSPVSGAQTLADFSPLTSQSPNRFYTYDPTSNLYTNVPPTNTFATGTGYLIRMPNTNVAAGYDDGTTAITYVGKFIGTANNGTYTLSGLTSDKFYSVGNPYPSPINGTTFLNNNATGGTLYFWRKTNGVANSNSAYATWTTLGGTVAGIVAPNEKLPTAVIQTGQGFIVKTGLTATSLTFSNGMRSNSVLNTYFFKTKQQTEPDRVWLNLTSLAGAFSQTLIGYLDGATLGVDNGIDGEYINDSPVALTSNINNLEYTIQGRPAFDVSDVVALNFKTDAAGDYAIALDHFDGVFATGQDIYLKDNNTGAETDLKAGSYTFTAAAGVDNARFSLKYQKTLKVDAPAFNENSVRVYKNNGTLYVNSGAVAISNIKVFDIQGRMIAEQKNVKANTAVINNLKATHQVLIVKISGEDNNVVTKKVVN